MMKIKKLWISLALMFCASAHALSPLTVCTTATGTAFADAMAVKNTPILFVMLVNLTVLVLKICSLSPLP